MPLYLVVVTFAVVVVIYLPLCFTLPLVGCWLPFCPLVTPTSTFTPTTHAFTPVCIYLALLPYVLAIHFTPHAFAVPTPTTFLLLRTCCYVAPHVTLLLLPCYLVIYLFICYWLIYLTPPHICLTTRIVDCPLRTPTGYPTHTLPQLLPRIPQLLPV